MITETGERVMKARAGVFCANCEAELTEDMVLASYNARHSVNWVCCQACRDKLNKSKNPMDWW